MQFSWRSEKHKFPICLVRRFRQSGRNFEGSERKLQNEGGVNDFDIQKAWEGTAVEYFEFLKVMVR